MIRLQHYNCVMNMHFSSTHPSLLLHTSSIRMARSWRFACVTHFSTTLLKTGNHKDQCEAKLSPWLFTDDPEGITKQTNKQWQRLKKIKSTESATWKLIISGNAHMFYNAFTPETILDFSSAIFQNLSRELLNLEVNLPFVLKFLWASVNYFTVWNPLHFKYRLPRCR